MLALARNGVVLRRIQDSGWVVLNGNDRVSPPTAGWTGHSGGDEFSIHAIQPFEVPDGKVRVGEPSYAIVDGVAQEHYEIDDYIPPEPAVPASITPAQAKAELFERGLLETAEQIVAEHPYPVVRIYWNNALSWDCNNAYVTAIAHELGIDEQLDELFIAASQRNF